MTNKIQDIFGKNVFTHQTMQKYMEASAYAEFKRITQNGELLSVTVADKVADAMMRWALEMGATHYTHWFQPLTGTTAEKHDSFLERGKDGAMKLEFSGKHLLKGETDASSFPSGGIRATFEARGYTVWDTQSPAFVKSDGGARVLYIPTAYCGYNGEALDKKTPLLRSMQALDREGVRLLKLLGENVNNVYSNVGGEQEYFLIEKTDYECRQDLKFCGRTLFGAPPPKGQEFNAQYFGIIKKRVAAFMQDLNTELWKMGISAKTQHNEVAPAQHEIVPIYATANIATDHNQLIMDSLKKVAAKHRFACLLHEKPFKGISGSGKHNNWSLSTDTGINLLKIGKTAPEHRRFLLIFTAVLTAVHRYADLVRASAATPGNEARMGSHEAPPNIISAYIGTEIEGILEDFMRGDTHGTAKQILNSGGISALEIYKDTSDRNRTSPFAFTGDKFEFRMVGSSATLSNPNTILNTIVADIFSEISQKLEADKTVATAKERLSSSAVDGIIKDLYNECKPIIFSGNNYSAEWVKEAKKRGLSNIDNCVDAYNSLVVKRNIEVFERQRVYTKTELEIRREIYLDTYAKTVSTEALTMLAMANTEIIPAVLNRQGELARFVYELRAAEQSLAEIPRLKLRELTVILSEINEAAERLAAEAGAVSKIPDTAKRAILMRDKVTPAMKTLRAACDRAETVMPKNMWPYPTYSDILFYKE